MIGQGRPSISWSVFPSRARAFLALWQWCIGVLALLLLEPFATNGNEPLRVRVEWGDGAARQWRGTISLSGSGDLSQPCPLGIEADEAAAMWIHEGRLIIHEQSPRNYDGVELLVDASLDDTLIVQLAANSQPEGPKKLEIPLTKLIDGYHDQKLDDRGNRLLVRRAPGDRLRVRVHPDHDSLVFSPADETLRLEITPALLPLPQGRKIHIKASLVETGHTSEPLWTNGYDVEVGKQESIPLDVGLPQSEGIYDLLIEATHDPAWKEAMLPRSLSLKNPLDWKKPVTVAARKVQLLVIDTAPVLAGPTATTGANVDLQQVGQDLEPANPQWLEKLGLDKLPQTLKFPVQAPRHYSSGHSRKGAQTPRGDLVQLAPNKESPDVSWEAYSIPVARVGHPHVIEIDYPSDTPQTLGVSIMEPNAAGALVPVGLDSGIHVDRDTFGFREAKTATHRLIFWPRTESPLLFLCNHQRTRPAMYGKIRVLAGWDRLPKAPSRSLGMRAAQTPLASAVPRGLSTAESAAPGKKRSLIAYLDTPLFPENFCAEESFDAWSRQSLDDWRTFYQGGTRLVEYLHHVGYDSLMLSVLADGSTIYPSRHLRPTPKFDTGGLFATAQDPIRKDILEMLLRLFDREGLQLIPMLEFSTPLPELESVLRKGGAAAAGIAWTNANGESWRQVHESRRGEAPHYNTLHPTVQEAMLNVIREVAERYGHHPSFGGIAIKLSPHGYAQLPSIEWGMDDETVARFQRDSRVAVHKSGPDRFLQRKKLLTGKQRRAWIAWRCAQLGRFYRQSVYSELTRIAPKSRLYLAGADMFAGPEFEALLRPSLAPRPTIGESLREIGIDAAHYRDTESIVLMRPETLIAAEHLSDEANALELGRMLDEDRYVATPKMPCFGDLSTPGSLFFHRPKQSRIASFDEKSPFKPAFTELLTHVAPSGSENRRRFAHALATLDSQIIADGGRMLPLGQEAALEDLLGIYRKLPAIRFRQVGNDNEIALSQPVTFRYATSGDRTYLYAVNDAPFAVKARVQLDISSECQAMDLRQSGVRATIRREGDRAVWMVDLKPYDLAAIALSEPGLTPRQPKVELPATVVTGLKNRMLRLERRSGSLLARRTPLGVIGNAGFEIPPAQDNPVPGWGITRREGVSITADKTQKHFGEQSVHLKTSGPWACMASTPFSTKPLGRLWVYAWLRVGDESTQPTVQVVLDGKHKGRYYRNDRAQRVLTAGQQNDSIGKQWTRCLYLFNDLPLQGLSELQVRFNLLGPAELWIDDVQVFDMMFDEMERQELNLLISVADYALEQGRTGEYLRFMDGYWPRMLEENLPEAPSAIGRKPLPRRPKPPRDESRDSFLGRMKSFVPESLRF